MVCSPQIVVRPDEEVFHSPGLGTWRLVLASFLVVTVGRFFVGLRSCTRLAVTIDLVLYRPAQMDCQETGLSCGWEGLEKVHLGTVRLDKVRLDHPSLGDGWQSESWREILPPSLYGQQTHNDLKRMQS